MLLEPKEKPMLDRSARRLIDPPLNALGLSLARLGITANGVTLAGLAVGLLAAISIAVGFVTLGLVLLLASRFADGLDGAVARATKPSDFGGYLDIVCDFAFYGAIPFAFALLNPANAVPAAALVLAFYVNGASFLGYAILAEKHGLETRAQGIKTLYYSNGLMEGTETILFFVAFCLFPTYFPALAAVFALLCMATTVLRVLGAYQLFTQTEDES